MKLLVVSVLAGVAECSSIFGWFDNKKDVYKGDKVLKTLADVQEMQQYTKIQGDLEVDKNYEGNISLPNLVEITGTFSF